jgi:hypothetical protein
VSGAPERDRAGRRWVIAGVTITAIGAALLVRLTADSRVTTGEADPGLPRATTDISSMTPRERADRLFNRVMAASERGDSTDVAFFGSMALQAYGLVDALDADARYHLGLMQLALHDPKAARAQADTIDRTWKHHLFAPLLRGEIARIENDTAARARARRDLLAQYAAELATGKPEYTDHRTALEAARKEARP